MEVWFILAVVSVFTAGFESFVHKVAAEKGYNAVLINLYGSISAVLLLLVCIYFFGSYERFWSWATFFVTLGAVAYFVTLILKIESLKQIDAAIFYPIYKVTGPLLAIMAGVFFFSERFSVNEWTGLTLSLMVPLLLVTKAENARQNNLLKGVYILLLAALAGSVSVALHKHGVDLSDNVLLLLLVAHAASLLSSASLLLQKNKTNVLNAIKVESDKGVILIGVLMGLLSLSSGGAIFFAFWYGGSLGIVYTISSIYILIPIVLSIIFYNEHWNVRKIFAIVLSVVALSLLR